MLLIYGSKNSNLIKDFWARLSIFEIYPKFLPLVLLIMPIVLCVAILISVCFGQSMNQFQVADEFLVMQGHNILSLGIMSLVTSIASKSHLGMRKKSISRL